MGRPSLGLNRKGPSPRLWIRLDPVLYARLLARAEAVGVTVPVFVRWVIKRACPAPLEEPITTELDWR